MVHTFENIGLKCQEYRLIKGLSQKNFSKILGISQGYLSDIENAKKFPSKSLRILLKTIININGNTQPGYKENLEPKISEQIVKLQASQTTSKGDTMYKEKYIKLMEEQIKLMQELQEVKSDLEKLKKAPSLKQINMS